MIKHRTSHGNSLALIIEKAILELLHITQDTPLEINTDGRNIILSTVDNKSREKQVNEALAKINKKYSKTPKALAG